MKTVYYLTTLSNKASKWVKDNLIEPRAFDGTVCIEWRYIDDIVRAMQESGLKINKDFNIL